MKKYVFFPLVFFLNNTYASDVVPQFYVASDNHYHPVSITTGLDASGKPVVRAYKGSDGQWHNTTVSAQICGLDAQNRPISCPSNSVSQETLESFIQKTEVNVANGIAQLDANKDLTNPVTSGTDWVGSWQKNSGSVDPFAQGYESALFGGQTETGEGNSTWNPRSVLIQSDPYGPFSAGCAFGVAMTGSVYNSQYPISGIDPRYGASAVKGVGGFDTVANCSLLTNTPARLILTASGYTKNTVKLTTPLTAAQAAQIHSNMYIVTNSPNTDLSPSSTVGVLPARNLYAGFVSTQPSAGATEISVYGWDVAGLGSGASGQVPQTKTLDTVWSAYTSPTVFLGGGAGGSAFAHNWFYNINASDLTPSSSNRSLIHQLTPLEVDLNIIGTAPKNSVYWQGISMNAGNEPAALTTDSRQVFLGGNINHHLVLDGADENWLIDGDNIYVPSTKNSSISSTRTAQIFQEWREWVSSSNTMRVVLWNEFGNPAATTGWQQAVVHLGPTIDGDPQVSGDPGGSKQGDIEWNREGNYGAVSICGYGRNCGFTLTGDGNISITGATAFNSDVLVQGGKTLYVRPQNLSNGLEAGWCAPDSYTLSICTNIGAWESLQVYGDLRSTAGGTKSTSSWHPDGHGNWYASNSTNDGGVSGGGAVATSSYTLATLPATNEQDGAQLWCSDCKLNNITGVAAYWHTSVSKWTDSQNNTLKN